MSRNSVMRATPSLCSPESAAGAESLVPGSHSAYHHDAHLLVSVGLLSNMLMMAGKLYRSVRCLVRSHWEAYLPRIIVFYCKIQRDLPQWLLGPGPSHLLGLLLPFFRLKISSAGYF